MTNFVLAIIIIFGGWWLLRQFANAQPAQLRGLLRKVAGGVIIALAGFLALRGAMNIAIPLFALGLGLLGQQALFPNGFPWGQKSPGQRSRVATSMLAMELDHDSGTMDGVVLAGPLQGRKLSSLNPAELRALHSQCAGAPDQSRVLLEAWLDRLKPEWRQDWGGSARSAGGMAAGGAMSRDEAYAVLGLKPGATDEDIRAAHRRLMKEFHPDRGGSDYLAAKINQAKDLLLQD
jgi:DnaJ-domain-containing protein 1